MRAGVTRSRVKGVGRWIRRDVGAVPGRQPGDGDRGPGSCTRQLVRGGRMVPWRSGALRQTLCRRDSLEAPLTRSLMRRRSRRVRSLLMRCVASVPAFRSLLMVLTSVDMSAANDAASSLRANNCCASFAFQGYHGDISCYFLAIDYQNSCKMSGRANCPSTVH